MISIGQLFTITYGSKQYHNKEFLKKIPGPTPLIASGGRNNGIYGRFDIPATKRHIITVASTGSAGAAFYHGYYCEVSDDALVLAPKVKLTPEEMLFVTYMIRLNQHRFHYGRKTTPERLAIVEIPELTSDYYKKITTSLDGVADDVAHELEEINLDIGAKAVESQANILTVDDLFDIQYGNSYELVNQKRDPTGINFVSRTTRNNGISARIARTTDEPFEAGNITVALGSQGGVLSTFVQFAPFYTGFHIAVLKPKKQMSIEEKLYYCLAIRLHRFRYNFGRQANKTLGKLNIAPPPAWARKDQLSNTQSAVADEIRAAVREPE